MSDFNKIEKATKLYNKIKEIDSEIIQIDKLAQLVARGDKRAVFEFKVEDPKKQITVSDDNDSYPDFHTMIFGTRKWMKKQEPEIPMESLNAELSQTTSLKLLSVLMIEKNEQREALIGKIKKLGFKI